jgi:hypothetical protein
MAGEELPDFQYDVPDWARDRTSKRAIAFLLKESREYASGAKLLLRDGEEDTALTAIDMAEEALDEARRLLGHRIAGSKPS